MTRHFRHSSLNVKLPVSLSNLSERPFRSVAVTIRSFPQLASLISTLTLTLRYNREMQAAEGDQGQTHCENRSIVPLAVLFHSLPSSTSVPTLNLITAKIPYVFMSFCHLLLSASAYSFPVLRHIFFFFHTTLFFQLLTVCHSLFKIYVHHL